MLTYGIRRIGRCIEEKLIGRDRGKRNLVCVSRRFLVRIEKKI